MTPDLAAVLTSLSGVVLGGGLSFAIQRASHRWSLQTQSRFQELGISERRREGRVAYVERFVAAAQEAEKVAHNRWVDKANDDEIKVRADVALERVWIAEKMLRVLCPPSVYDPANAFAFRLHNVVEKGPGEVSVRKYLQPTREVFLNSCRREYADY
jgi:hypothetical protein